MMIIAGEEKLLLVDCTWPNNGTDWTMSKKTHPECSAEYMLTFWKDNLRHELGDGHNEENHKTYATTTPHPDDGMIIGPLNLPCTLPCPSCGKPWVDIDETDFPDCVDWVEDDNWKRDNDGE